MLRTALWNIFEIDGHYLGQSRAFAPEIAFCQYMSLLGKDIGAGDLEFVAADERSGFITYGSQEYLLTSINQFTELMRSAN